MKEWNVLSIHTNLALFLKKGGEEDAFSLDDRIIKACEEGEIRHRPV